MVLVRLRIKRPEVRVLLGAPLQDFHLNNCTNQNYGIVISGRWLPAFWRRPLVPGRSPFCMAGTKQPLLLSPQRSPWNFGLIISPRPCLEQEPFHVQDF